MNFFIACIHFKKTTETVFVKNECFITPFLLAHTLNDLFDLQDDLAPLELRLKSKRSVVSKETAIADIQTPITKMKTMNFLLKNRF